MEAPHLNGNKHHRKGYQLEGPECLDNVCSDIRSFMVRVNSPRYQHLIWIKDMNRLAASKESTAAMSKHLPTMYEVM